MYRYTRRISTDAYQKILQFATSRSSIFTVNVSKIKNMPFPKRHYKHKIWPFFPQFTEGE